MATECLYLAMPSDSACFSFARLRNTLPAFSTSISDAECRLESQGEYVFLRRLDYIPGDLEDEDFQLPKGAGCFHIYWVEFSSSSVFEIVIRALASVEPGVLMTSDWFSGPIAEYKYR
jgi:hypothetical protein